MDFFKDTVNFLAAPYFYFVLTSSALAVFLWKREALTSNRVGYVLFGFLTLFFLFGMTDENFRLIVGKPDNVPITALIFLLIFFTWYSMRQAVRNDRRLMEGRPPVEKDEADRVWVWPDLVYTELIALILCSAVLIVWSIALKAPLEQRRIRRIHRTRRRRPGTSWDSRRCWCTSTPGWPGSCCRA